MTILDAMLLAAVLAADPGVPASPAGPRAEGSSAAKAPAPAAAPLPPPVSRTFQPAAAAPRAKVTRVGVPEPNGIGKVSAREAAVLSQALVTEVRKVDGVGAIGVAEIRQMLAHEYRRQMLGCQSDQSCLAEIAGALGVDELVSSELVVEGATSTLLLSRIDLRTTKVLGSVQRRLARRNAGEEVLGALGEAVAALYPDRALRAGEQRGVAPQVARWLNPPPLPRWVFFATAGVAAAAAGGGALYALQADATRSRYNAALHGATVSGAELRRLRDEANGERDRATILFGVAGGVAVAAAVEAFFTDWHDDRAAVMVTPAGVSVVTRF